MDMKTKLGEISETMADQVGALVGLSEGEIDSLTKANKTALMKILAKLA